MTYTEVIVKHLKLANHIAGRFVRLYPHEKDEIYSAAYYGLVKAATKPQVNQALATRWIEGRIKRAIDAIFPASHSDRRFLARYLDQHGNLEERSTALGLRAEYVLKRLVHMNTVVQLEPHHDIAAKPESQLSELLEVCLTYLPERIQRTFLLKFRDEYTFREIAELTGVSQRMAKYHVGAAVSILQQNKQSIADLLS